MNFFDNITLAASLKLCLTTLYSVNAVIIKLFHEGKNHKYQNFRNKLDRIKG